MTFEIFGFFTLLLILTHGFGTLFEKIKQPPVVGEILAGLILGPSLLLNFYPHALDFFHVNDGWVDGEIFFIKEVGLIFLMFLSGFEVRSLFGQDKTRPVSIVILTSTIIPVIIAFCILPFINTESMMGAKNSTAALYICIALGLTVTSIPVISRILIDLDIIKSTFSRFVISVAAIEDIILNLMLAIAVGLVTAGGGDSLTDLIIHASTNIIFIFLALTYGSKVLAWLQRHVFARVMKRNSTAMVLAMMFGFTYGAWHLGVPIFLGAFMYGIAASRYMKEQDEDLHAIGKFAFAFFIPLYFGLVGFRLNLFSIDVLQLAVFFIAACSVKLVGTYIGARYADFAKDYSMDMSVAMIAKGGPGIVLAMVAIDAGIISESFYTSLILTVILTSVIVGTWLDRAKQREPYPAYFN